MKITRLEKEFASPFKKLGTRLTAYLARYQRWIYLVILSFGLSFLLFPSILRTPKVDYSLGDVANKDIKASHDFLVEDNELTKQRRDEAVKASLYVYDVDTTGAYLTQRIRESFSLARKELERLSIVELEPTLRSETLAQFRETFFEILGIIDNPALFDQLVEQGFSSAIEESVLEATSRILDRGVVGNSTVLMTQKGKGIILRDIDTQQELKVDELDRFYDLEGARQHVGQIINRLLANEDDEGISLASVLLAQRVIRPNITFNIRETELRKEEARKSVTPIYFKVKSGEMIVREGEKITSLHLLKLETEAALQERYPQRGMALSMAVIIGILLTLSYRVLLGSSNTFRGDSRSLLFNSSTLLLMFLVVLLYKIVAEEIARGFHFFTIQTLLFALPVPLGAILVSIFQGLEVAVAFSLIISVLTSIILDGGVELFVYFLLGSLLAAYGVRYCRERMVLIKTGIKVGILNMAMAVSIQILQGDQDVTTGAISLMAGFMGGALAGVIATGFLPLIEMLFGFTTDIKLLELSSLDQPVLKDLMVKAPGTYHHSVVVSNMVEATAESINANPLLAKVSAYYHDIGKIKKPLYFVENQRKGDNRHEKLAPSMSSLILTAHVKDGVELAKQHRLGKEIIDIIKQHHGTSLITYFYSKAREQVKKRGSRTANIKEEDFRYPGPKPQTKEAGLVLVADAVEAASRTLVDPTPARIKGMVQKIINNVFSDGQLDECELTLKDLNRIEMSFTKTLGGIFHSRIEYPEPVTKGKGESVRKREDGNSNNFAASNEKNGSREDKEKARQDLKRLGIS
ncbi:MAG: HDIG domain-containing protein [Deltaproteobacteria bacterium]|nr:HDIG domain-containing protein [Deltaproteobacteria bacterium]